MNPIDRMVLSNVKCFKCGKAGYMTCDCWEQCSCGLVTEKGKPCRRCSTKRGPLGSHSATVEAWLDCGVHGRIPLARLSPKSVVAKAECVVPPCDADLVVVVDGDRRETRVRLVSGFRLGRLAARVLTAPSPRR